MELESELFLDQLYLQYSDGQELIKWLINIQEKYNICEHTFCNGIEILRRAFAKLNITHHYFYLVGIVCLMIAYKFDDDNDMLCSIECVKLCDFDYSLSEVNTMEWYIFYDILACQIPRCF